MSDTPKLCKSCGKPARDRSNGRSLGYCNECFPTKAVAVGTITTDNAGRRRVKLESGDWVLCDDRGRPFDDPWVAGRLSEIVAKYEMVPAGALLAVTPSPSARPTDPPTSKIAAAVAANPGRFQPGCWRVLEALEQAGGHGLLDAEMGLWPPTASKRRGECEKAGYVRTDGDMRTTARGGAAQVRRITEAGRQALAGRASS